jgi:transcriptional regulator with PAS, ATPase and Fis domain
MSGPSLEDGTHESEHPDPFHDLLFTLAGALDVREVFHRLSAIVARIIPHDRMTMSFDDRSGHVVMQVASNGDLAHVERITLADDWLLKPSDGFFIVDDLRGQSMPIAEPADFQDRMVTAGYRSFLAVNAPAQDKILGLEFWSKQPNAFRREDVPIARRVADYVALTVSHEQLAEAARQAAESRARAERLERCVKTLVEQTDLKVGSHRVVGRSEQWLKVLRTAAQVASTDTTVLLSGESGTGKEVIARLIHEASNRKGGPFVALNCAALPESLLESELFGYERGAFTGANQAKPGQIELAAGGVFFLDEVSEMSLAAQAKFLRVLQEREFQRLGGTRVRKADVRVIAATNRNLSKAVERGAFREDLYYRIQVFDIRIPPLRDHKEDILPLCNVFLEEIGISHGRPSAGLTRSAEAALLQYDWPGNVRELHNVLERAAILSDGAPITAQHLSLRAECVAAVPTTDLTVVERRTIEQVMRDTGWNKSRAAKRLGLSRTQLYGRLRKYVLEEPAYAAAE